MEVKPTAIKINGELGNLVFLLGICRGQSSLQITATSIYVQHLLQNRTNPKFEEFSFVLNL